MTNLQKAIVVFGTAGLLFWIIKPKPKKSLELGFNGVQEADPKERTKITAPTMSKKDAKANPKAGKAFKALQAYVSAYNSGETQENLDKLNDELAHEMGMRVYRRRQDNKLAVKDLNDKDIIVNNG
jgi:hypothetical protein